MDDEPLIRKQAPWMVGIALAGMALLFLQWLSAHNSMETISYSKFEELTLARQAHLERHFRSVENREVMQATPDLP